MVAQANPGGGDPVSNELADLRRQLGELARKVGYPMSVSPNGVEQFSIKPDPQQVLANGQPMPNVFLGYGDGSPALTIQPGNPAYGSKQQLVIRDLAGNATYVTDESAGYGLAHPSDNYPVTADYSAITGAAVTAGTEVLFGICEGLFYNPAYFIKMMITSNVAYTYRVVINVDGVYMVSSSVGSGTANSSLIMGKTVMLDSTMIGAQGVSLRVLVTPSANTSGLKGWGGRALGVSKAFYDNNPGFQ